MAKKRSKNSLVDRLNGHANLLEDGFNAVPSFFLANYAELKPNDNARGLNSSEAILLIQLLDFKWTEDAPFPSIETLANRMGQSPRHVRDMLRTLEQLGLIERRKRVGQTNEYHLDGLFERLDELYQQKAGNTDEGGQE